MKESALQAKVIKYLKGRGCYVIKTSPGMGTPVGCPDIIALLEGCWVALEIKASATSPYRPLQKETLEKLDDWSYAKAVHSGNWDSIKKQLDDIL